MARNKGRKLIEEKFLDSNDLFGLEFKQGFVFLEVLNWEPLTYNPYSAVGNISATSASDWTRLEDDGDDILFVEKGVRRVIHGSIGMHPKNVRQYVRYPEGQQQIGMWPNLSTPAPSNGSDYGYVDGDESPYSSPTDELELFIPPGVHLDFRYYNAGNNDTTPKLNLNFRNYVVRPLKPRNNPDDLNAVKRIMKPGTPIPIAPVGTIGVKDDFALDSWKVEPVNRDEANRLLNKGGGR